MRTIEKQLSVTSLLGEFKWLYALYADRKVTLDVIRDLKIVSISELYKIWLKLIKIMS